MKIWVSLTRRRKADALEARELDIFDIEKACCSISTTALDFSKRREAVSVLLTGKTTTKFWDAESWSGEIHLA